ncbi:unnamed protein product [Spirodela intermedia]|uniref:Uncharacterized protein n=1 Tax=Spirodela intermedia TaxID=51605 RepID=A0A7I8KU20_SPIIN|nr:unnamed protein product [Spirodela intermedia]
MDNMTYFRLSLSSSNPHLKSK